MRPCVRARVRESTSWDTNQPLRRNPSDRGASLSRPSAVFPRFPPFSPFFDQNPPWTRPNPACYTQRMASTPDRDESGQFQPGNPGGPGRPPRSLLAAAQPTLSSAQLGELATAANGPHLYLTALAIAERGDWLEKIARDFPPAVAARIRALVDLADLAEEELSRRIFNDLPK